MTTISHVEEFSDSGDPSEEKKDVEPFDQPADSADEIPEEDTEEKAGEEMMEDAKAPADAKSPKTSPEKSAAPETRYYFFNGRQLTADELYQESILLQAEFTRRNQEPGKPSSEPAETSAYDPKQVEEFRKFGRAIGVVFKDEQEKDATNSIWSSFLKDHPEYANPIESRRLSSELARYNNKPEFLKQNLEEAHRNLHPATKGAAEAKIRARSTVARRAQSGATGTTQQTLDSKFKNHSPAAIAMAKKMGLLDE